MHYSNDCGGYCGPVNLTKDDEVAILKEREKILEAKLATIRHMIETEEKSPKSSEEKQD